MRGKPLLMFNKLTEKSCLSAREISLAAPSVNFAPEKIAEKSP
jgi:hypothetical protein